MSFEHVLHVHYDGFMSQSETIAAANDFSEVFFKPLVFKNRFVEGEPVFIRGYNLGEVFDIGHHHDGKESYTRVTLEGGDLREILKSEEMFHDIADLVDHFANNDGKKMVRYIG